MPRESAARVGRLHDEVHVIRLNREVDDAERGARRRRDGASHDRGDRLLAKRRQPPASAHRDVNRKARAMHGPRAMRDGTPVPTGSPSTHAPPTPRTRLEPKGELTRRVASQHLNKGIYYCTQSERQHPSGRHAGTDRVDP